jgi:hypothetical protein
MVRKKQQPLIARNIEENERDVSQSQLTFAPEIGKESPSLRPA